MHVCVWGGVVVKKTGGRRGLLGNSGQGPDKRRRGPNSSGDGELAQAGAILGKQENQDLVTGCPWEGRGLRDTQISSRDPGGWCTPKSWGRSGERQ